jgi:hypothetical protein
MQEHSENWDALVQSIADGEAVLVLGPDAIPFYSAIGGNADEEISFSELSRRRISDSLNGQINYFYKRDNLFQFSNAAAKQQAMKEVRNAARDQNWLPDTELLRQIVEIPFPLVLNINPDKFIYDAFIQYYRQPQFDYFTTKDKPNPPKLEYPDGLNKPLVYNVCGSMLDKLDSIILDYHDLFDLLKKILSDYGVDESISRKLQEADRFVLLGFELERWYFQLLLHYVNKVGNNPFNNINQNFPIFSQVSEDTRTFVMQQFNIQHIAPTRYDFEQLYQACKRKGILRKIHDPASSNETKIRTFTEQGKFEEAFQLLEKHVGEVERNIDLPHLRSRYNAWLEARKSGLTNANDLEVEINRIRYTLLTYSAQLPKP